MYSKIINLIFERREIQKLKPKIPELFSRQGKIKGHKIKCEFRKDTTTTQQKGKRIPLLLQDAVEAVINKLLKEGHIRRVDKISDDVFIQPVVTPRNHKTYDDYQEGQNRQDSTRCQSPE